MSAPRADRFRFERRLHSRGLHRIAGVDEAGRGPLAGPVVCAAVLLPVSWIREGLPGPLSGIDDSKRLGTARRQALFGELLRRREVHWSAIAVSPAEIDRRNILGATHRGMGRCLLRLGDRVEHVLVDGLPVPSLPVAQTALVRGDARSYSIAAASILAKTIRDRILGVYDRRYPGYGFARHKGYPTRAHLQALDRLGPAPIHRTSFAPVRERMVPVLP